MYFRYQKVLGEVFPHIKIAEEDENRDVRAVCDREMGKTKVEMISGSE